MVPRLAALLLVPVALGAQGPALPADLGQMLRASGFGRQDLAELAAGQAISRLLDDSPDEQTAAIAAVRIRGSLMDLVEHLRAIEKSESGPAVTAVGRFSTPPVLADLAALPLPPADLEDLRRCRPGACAINLPASAIERFSTEVAWSAADAPARAEALVREILLDYVRRYQEVGNDALVVYQDRGEPISVKDSSLRLFERAAVLTARMPTLSTYFYYFPKAPLPPGAHETYYWSQAGFGLKPVTRVNHAVLAPVSPGGTRGWIMASRQLYASHYFRDALELRFIHPDTANPSGYYFVCINRALSDSLRGVTGTLVGGVVRKEVREGMARYVASVKRAMEGA